MPGRTPLEKTLAIRLQRILHEWIAVEEFYVDKSRTQKTGHLWKSVAFEMKKRRLALMKELETLRYVEVE